MSLCDVVSCLPSKAIACRNTPLIATRLSWLTPLLTNRWLWKDLKFEKTTCDQTLLPSDSPETGPFEVSSRHTSSTGTVLRQVQSMNKTNLMKLMKPPGNNTLHWPQRRWSHPDWTFCQYCLAASHLKSPSRSSSLDCHILRQGQGTDWSSLEEEQRTLQGSCRCSRSCLQSARRKSNDSKNFA